MTLTDVDLQALAEETVWLANHPDFRERPATLVEFLGPDYLNIRDGVRERIVEVLADIMGHEVSAEKPTAYPKAMFTGGIGIGKTTVASIVLTYLCHWVLCLNDPEKYFGLLPGSRIAFMMMSTKGDQAKKVLFGDTKARVTGSRWFKNHPMDPAFKNEIRFPTGSPEGGVWILPGDSADTTFEGYNILGGIIDEADSHQITERKDYAQDGYDVILNRIKSRFQSRGFIMIIGQMKSAAGFAARMYNQFQSDPEAYVAKLTIWESFGWDFYREPDTGELKTFWYDTKRKELLSEDVVKLIGEQENMIRVPWVYREEFVNNPQKALKDLAGIPPLVNSPFISLTDRIPQGRTAWIERFGEHGPVRSDGRLEPWFVAPNTLPRVAHIDLGYSPNGDAAAVVMGHIPQMVEIAGELKPFIVIDMLYRFTAVSGKEIELGDIRQLIYTLKDVRKFRIVGVTMDGFQSKDTEQQLIRRRIPAGYLSVDREVLPYHDLKEAIYENRIAFPPYIVPRGPNKPELVEILLVELEQLMDTGKKIDHPQGGSKDVADAVAGVVSNLMGNTSLHRGRHQSDYGFREAPGRSPYTAHRLSIPMTPSHPAYRGPAAGMPVPDFRGF